MWLNILRNKQQERLLQRARAYLLGTKDNKSVTEVVSETYNRQREEELMTKEKVNYVGYFYSNYDMFLCNDYDGCFSIN